MERAAAFTSADDAVFRDGLGERRRVTDPLGQEARELLCIRGELSAVPAFEFALRERVSRLASFRHAYFAQVRSVERLTEPEATLGVVSDRVDGIRLSELFACAAARGLNLDVNAALCLLRQLVPAVAKLHETAQDVAHAGLGPERIIVTPNARLVITEYVLGSALEQLRYSQERYWKDLRIALPRSAGLPHFDQRADVTQIGVVALSLILGRLLRDDEYPSRIGDVVASAWAVSPKGGFEPLPAGIRGWLGRCLQLDARNSFANAIEANAELEQVLSDSEYIGLPASLVSFLARYHGSDAIDQYASEGAPAPVAAPAGAAREGEPRGEFPFAPPAAISSVPGSVIAQFLEETTSSPAPSDDMLTLAASVTARPKAVTPAPKMVPQVPVPPKPEAPAPTGAMTGAAPAAMPAPVAVASPASVAAPLAFKPPAAAASKAQAPQAPRPPAPVAPKTDDSADAVFAHAALPEATRDMFGGQTAAPSGRSKTWMAVAAAAVVLVAVGVPLTRSLRSPAPAAPTTGTIDIATNPPGATAVIDGQPSGTTPVTLTLHAGSHTLELRGMGEPRTIPLMIAAGTQVSHYIDLPKPAPSVGQLNVHTEPAGATVTVDGVKRGTTPMLVPDLSPGDHVVSLDSDAGSYKQTVTIDSGGVASLMVPLSGAAGAPASGWVSIASPIELQLREGDRVLGTSLSDRIMLPVGKHDVELVNDTLGFRASRSVQVASGKLSPLKVDVPNGTMSLNALPWADVWLDGERIGETPIGNFAVPIGTHEVVLRHPELGEQHHKVAVSLKEVARVSVDLRKK